MHRFWKKYSWIPMTVVGSALFALGFDLFLLPHDLNAGGVSGLAMVIRQVLPFASVGLIQIFLNLPLFLLGGVKIGKKFFFGSLLGMAASSLLIDVFAAIPVPETEPLLALLYGSLLCGVGIGAVFACGTSTGGSDILVRLLKLQFRNVPVGQIGMCIDLVVSVLTGLVFQDVTRTLYTAVAVFITCKVMDAVIYRFDYSKVALIVSDRYEAISSAVGERLGRGATYLYGEGSYTGRKTKVVLVAFKRQQFSELKELVTNIDPNAFIIVQEAHQVLGDGFTRYSKNAL